MVMDKPDLLIFMSDQHNALCNGFAGDSLIETPNLDKIAAGGTVFETAYTSCPLCVPARMSMLTNKLPSSTNIFDNGGAIPEDEVTFLHSLAAEGYETVFCGRMHFKGEDQRHGFTKRIMDDITVNMWGKRQDFGEELGPFNKTLGMGGCLDLIGGGNSPVLEY
ncbi:MAG: sulfatase-like hydrolase/transferase, partial [Bacillota bacterium]